MGSEQKNKSDNEDRRRYVFFGDWKTCLNCKHWVPKVEQAPCTRFHVLPPPEIIVYGCEEWIEKVPF